MTTTQHAIPGLLSRPTAAPRRRVKKGLVVDVFCGAGGTGLGLEKALGRAVDVAINHSPLACKLYRLNHPHTSVIPTDVWDVDPSTAAEGRPVSHAWFSPDCTHFSTAKGGTPVDRNIRSLAWVVLKWALDVRPRVILVENVPCFTTWGPLMPHPKHADKLAPDPERKGEYFAAFLGALGGGMERPRGDLAAELHEYFGADAPRAIGRMMQGLGYTVEWRNLVAADYGAPTIRKRFILVARCDGKPIVWPEKTHVPRNKLGPRGAEEKKPWRAAAECIDWSLPCPSIFERKRPLAEATMNRIARGIRKYVLEAEEPFIVCCNHAGREFRGQGLGEPMKTLTASRDAHGLVTPILSKYHGECLGEKDGRGADLRDPLKTQDTQNRFALVSPTLVQTGYGERPGQKPRVPGLEKPLGTVVGGGSKHALVEAFLSRICQTGSQGPGVRDGRAPLTTVVSKNEHCLTTAHLQKYYTTSAAAADGRDPMPTVTGVDHNALCTAHLTKLYGTCRHGADAREPMPTVTSGGGHLAEVRAFLVKYFSTGGQDSSLRDPMHTLTARHRMGLVTVRGEEYQIVDIGLRMLEPRELLAAQFGRYADEYVLFGTKAQQVEAIGNSVPPELVEAVVRANP